MRFRAIVVVAALLLAGCGDGGNAADRGETPPVASPSYNDTDVMYLQMMLAHHEPAAKLLALGADQASRPEVAALAGDLAAAQARETATIRGWLGSWGQPLVSGAHADVHAAHGGVPLLDDAEMLSLAGLDGADFDTAFLNILIGHQHGAVELSTMETAAGVNPEARAFAAETDETVRAQIQRMLRMVSAT